MMQTVLLIYGIIGVGAGFLAILGISSLMGRQSENLSVKERQAVSVINNARYAFWIIILIVSVSAWPLLVAMYLNNGKGE